MLDVAGLFAGLIAETLRERGARVVIEDRTFLHGILPLQHGDLHRSKAPMGIGVLSKLQIMNMGQCSRKKRLKTDAP